MATTLIADYCEIWRAPVVSGSYGEDKRDWDNATRVAKGRVSIQPSFGSEETVDRQTTFQAWRLISDDPALMGVIEPTDRVHWRSLVLEVDNEAHDWVFFASDHHVECQLRRVLG